MCDISDDAFACSECEAYGNDYYVDETGELVSNCDTCPIELRRRRAKAIPKQTFCETITIIERLGMWGIDGVVTEKVRNILQKAKTALYNELCAECGIGDREDNPIGEYLGITPTDKPKPNNAYELYDLVCNKTKEDWK